MITIKLTDEQEREISGQINAKHRSQFPPPPDGNRLATDWERENCEYPKGVKVSCTVPGCAWQAARSAAGWRDNPRFIFAVPFPHRPSQEWLDKCGVEIVGDWPKRVFSPDEMWIVIDKTGLPAGVVDYFPGRGVPSPLYFDGYRYQVRRKLPLLKDADVPKFKDLPKDEKMRILEALVDDPGSVLYLHYLPWGVVWRPKDTKYAIQCNHETRYVIAAEWNTTGALA
jgi:hypothetical protein